MTRAFSFIDGQQQPQVGVEWQGKRYNFTRAWEYYKQIALKSRGPSFQFLQLVIEMDLFYQETFDELFETLKQHRSLTDLQIRGHTTLKPPIERPQKIIGVGRNYRDHAAELDNPEPEEPIIFAKPPSSIVTAGDFIRLPKGVGRVDHEGEIGIVIGKTAAGVKASEASDHIAGYMLVNDVTARDLQKQDQKKSLPWFRAKGFDTFCPIGPYLVPANAIAGAGTLAFEVFVNDELRQQGNTRDLIFPIVELVAYISRHMTLYPGDIIATGTPAGVAPLRKGDVVEIKSTELGILHNKVQ